MTKENAIKLLSEYFNEEIVWDIVDALKQSKPLTDKEIDEIPFALFVPNQPGMSTTEALREFARAIEAAHGIKE